jgi:hypothetical protein
MIRDGRLPTPEAAKAARETPIERDRERRAKRPSDIARRELREAEQRALHEHFDLTYGQLEKAERDEPLYELVLDLFDLADPDLWKRNSFARLRDRLLLMLREEIARLEHDRLSDRRRDGKRRFERHERSPYHQQKAARLARAKELLTLLLREPTP